MLRVWLGPIILRCVWRDPKRSGFASRRLVSRDAVELADSCILAVSRPADFCYAQVDGLEDKSYYSYSYTPRGYMNTV